MFKRQNIYRQGKNTESVVPSSLAEDKKMHYRHVPESIVS